MEVHSECFRDGLQHQDSPFPNVLPSATSECLQEADSGVSELCLILEQWEGNNLFYTWTPVGINLLLIPHNKRSSIHLSRSLVLYVYMTILCGWLTKSNCSKALSFVCLRSLLTKFCIGWLYHKNKLKYFCLWDGADESSFADRLLIWSSVFATMVKFIKNEDSLIPWVDYFHLIILSFIATILWESCSFTKSCMFPLFWHFQTAQVGEGTTLVRGI